jgi:hypothetical protein
MTMRATVLLSVMYLFLASSSSAAGTVLRYPDVPLEEGERIVAVKIQLQGVKVGSISNIPSDWDVHLHLDSQFAPTISSGCAHASSALTSPQSLPLIELKSSDEPIVGEVTFYAVRDFESGKGREIRLKIPVQIQGNKP